MTINLTFDIDRARRETRYCDDILHFNNAGSSLVPIPVSDAVHAYLRQEERMGGYETADAQADALANFYSAASRLLNCQPDEIAFVENATRAWDLVFYGFRFQRGDKILTTVSEYGSNVIAYLQQAERLGVEIVFVPDDEHGQIDVAALENLIDDRVKLISISHIPTYGGLVNPAVAVGKVANAAGVPYLLDACQSVGQMPVDVQQIGCDMLSTTGRKYLRGPRGTGLLYVREGFIEQCEPAFLDQFAAELTAPNEYRMFAGARRYETFERFFAGQVGLGVAMEYTLGWGLETIQQRIYGLAAELRQQLAQIDGVRLTDSGREQCGLVTFSVEQMAATALKQALHERGINVSTGTGSGMLVSFQQRGIHEIVRASVHYFNTVGEIGRFTTTLREVLSQCS